MSLGGNIHLHDSLNCIVHWLGKRIRLRLNPNLKPRNRVGSWVFNLVTRTTAKANMLLCQNDWLWVRFIQCRYLYAICLPYPPLLTKQAHSTTAKHKFLISFLHFSRMLKKRLSEQTKIKCDSLYMLLGNFESFIVRKLFTEIFLSCPNKDAVILATPLHHAKRQGAESLPKSYRCEKPLKPMMAGGRIYTVYHPIKVY